MGVIGHFFEPNWKKLCWFFLAYFVAQIYFHFIFNQVPSVWGNLIGFIMNPATVLAEPLGGFDMAFAAPFAATIDAVWLYIVACVISSETERPKNSGGKK
ncbi:MAG: hypothetical protein WC308_04195 [archaeon]|jgi:energy-coupling factor transporter transmembrane protein EcfT